MNIELSNFNFLKEFNFYLYSLAKDVERNMFVDNDVCLYKSRKIVEAIIKDIYVKEGIENLYTRNQYINIKQLYSNNYITELLYRNMNIVREECNYSVHNNINELNEVNELNEKVIRVVKSTYFVCAYYVKLYFDSEVKISSFKSDYYLQDKISLYDKEAREVIAENEFFNNMLRLFIKEVNEYMQTKNEFNITVNLMNEIQLKEFFNIYIETLKYIIVKNENSVNDIIKFKGLCMKKLNSTDGNQINMYISKLIYDNLRTFNEI